MANLTTQDAVNLIKEAIDTYVADYTYTIGSQDTYAVSIHHAINIGDISAGTQTNDIKITLDGESVTVTSTDLDIRDLAYTQDSVRTHAQALTSNGVDDGDYNVTLSANTATQIPESGNVPAYDYVLILGKRSDTAMVWGATTSIVVASAIDKGIPLQSSTGAATIRLKANENIYVACSATKDLDYTIMSIEEGNN